MRHFNGSIAIVGAMIAAVAAATCSAGVSDSGGNGGSGASAANSDAATGSFDQSTGSGFMTNGASSGTGMQPGQCDAASCQLAGGACTNDVCIINENTGNVDGNTKGLLDGGGAADSSFKWLYPYDQTVFPRGLLAPTMQFDGTAADALKVHVTFPGMDYTGYYGASSPIRLAVSDVVWKALTLGASAQSAVQVDVTKVSGGQASGPITETWTIAQGSLRGTIYYETYDSVLAGGVGSVGIMKIAPGTTTPTVIKTGCGNVCHTASADGSRLVASTAFPLGSSSYDLQNNAAVIKAQPDNSFTYGGITPDGSTVISATNYRTWLGSPSRIYDTQSGANIPTASWDSVITNAAMPAFSADGKWVVFNHEDTGGGRSLATMQFDAASKSFSGLADLISDPSAYLGWPAFTPDSKWVVYHAGDNAEFETDAGAQGNLFMVDAATHQSHRLDALDGYTGTQTYLPAADPNLNFAPTVLPEAVGGYFWVVFTSHRSYGNTLPTQDNGDQNGKLWVAAINIDATDGQDASHPAFYLDGQEASADNLRGFWVLDPCKADALNCQTGDECCGGYCRDNGNGQFVCNSNKSGCSQDFEKCSVAADCCNGNDQCINGKCASPPPN